MISYAMIQRARNWKLMKLTPRALAAGENVIYQAIALTIARPINLQVRKNTRRLPEATVSITLFRPPTPCALVATSTLGQGQHMIIMENFTLTNILALIANGITEMDLCLITNRFSKKLYNRTGLISQSLIYSLNILSKPS